MSRTNFITEALSAIHSVLEADSALGTLVDDKFWWRAINDRDFEPGKAPFFAGWPTIPDQVWYTMGAGQKIQLQVDFWACVNANDREDLDDITQIYVEALGALTDDLCSTSSTMRSSGRISVFQVNNPLFVYGTFEDLDEGIFVLQMGGRFDVQNPNFRA